MKKKYVKSSWKEYFNFSTRERKGAFVLAMVITVQLSILLALRLYRPSVNPVNEKQFLEFVHELAVVNRESVRTFSNHAYSKTIQRKDSLFSFDPNAVSSAELMLFGLKPFQAKMITRFAEKGGKYRVKYDLAKIYSIDSLTFLKMKPYLLLPDSIVAEKREFKKKEILKVDVATADSTELDKLRGIGASFASRIVKYRNAVGGFVTINQLKEVFGITDSLFDALRPAIFLSDSLPDRYIHLNSDSLSVLSAHPYIRRKSASGIIAYRNSHGHFSSVDEIAKLPFVTEEMFRKLAPYLRTE